ncbi:DUF262 domain-containing protein [Flavobacterium pectinovorum]|uniref:GmrSD restriction endonucleases N-terminal domain-containing protein n=1 Tax=Flavobacterium pectinovorum TaxID=29533 RepID=A0AB36P475_9FLAO|nr:DUF262 domain-containing protein [Flavobacterium pectinovorum]OXB06712.1 hypothetical protein B0A72_04355 [Flavobacterium pectinovorum]SHL42501.1 Protein of unknown function DUF262 [Flavobacterium pectinovorum]
MEKFQPQIYRINDILSWSERKELILSPKFQRRTVWSPRGKSYLIDSILKGFPIPPFFIREKILVRERKTVREVVDGQQRLRTILEFVADGFSVMKIHNEEVASLKYSQLPEELQQIILSYPLSVNTLIGTDDSTVFDIFSRLNAYSVPLNDQEKLNALYVGVFKQFIDKLSKNQLIYWEENKIISKSQIGRMKEVEFTAELVCAMLFGIQNGKKIIRDSYKKYDDEFVNTEILEERFAQTLEECKILLDDNIKELEFKRMPLFYSVFTALYDLKYGFGDLEANTGNEMNLENLADVQTELYKINSTITGDDEYEEYEGFKNASTSSTDKMTNRTYRHGILKEIIRPIYS